MPRTFPAAYIYFLQAEVTGLIKIGKTSTGATRPWQLVKQNSEPCRILALCPTLRKAEEMERRWHESYVDSRVHGEWFRPTEDLIQRIRCLQDGLLDVYREHFGTFPPRPRLTGHHLERKQREDQPK